jgi:hypothetical protein
MPVVARLQAPRTTRLQGRCVKRDPPGGESLPNGRDGQQDRDASPNTPLGRRSTAARVPSSPVWSSMSAACDSWWPRTWGSWRTLIGWCLCGFRGGVGPLEEAGLILGEVGRDRLPVAQAQDLDLYEKPVRAVPGEPLGDEPLVLFPQVS